MQHDVARWLEKNAKESKRYSERLRALTPDDSSGWGNRLMNFAVANDSPCYCPGVLLIGPNGCGKHNAVCFLNQELLQLYRGCQFCFLYGDMLNDEYDSFAELEENLNALLDARYDVFAKSDKNDSGALCIILEEPEEYSCAKQLYRFLGQNHSEYLLANDYPLFFIIVIAQSMPDIDSVLRKNLMLCRLTCPDTAKRKLFFKRNAAVIPGDISMDWLASRTEGFSYTGLIDLIRQLATESAINDNLSDDVINTVIETQRQPQSYTEVPSGIPVQIIQQTPGMPPAPVQSVPDTQNLSYYDTGTATASIDDSPAALDKKRAELEAMPTKQATIEAYGKLGAQRLFNTAGI